MTPTPDPSRTQKAMEYIDRHRRDYRSEAIDQKLREQGYSDEEIAAAWKRLEPDGGTGTLDPGFWRTYWLIVGGGYLLVFVALGLWTGFLLHLPEGGIMFAAITLLVMLMALSVSVAIARGTRAVRLGLPHGMLIAFLVPFAFLFLVAGGCVLLFGPQVV